MHIGITTAWSYAWSVLSACLVLGIAIYLIDRKYGIHVYRFLYDFFHRNPMPVGVERGFLYSQSTNRGVTVAAFLSTVYSLYMVWQLGFSMSFIAELFVWLLMTPMLVAGFLAGRWIYKLLLRRSVYLDRLDTLGEQMEHIQVADVAERVREKGTSLFSRLMPGGFMARKVPEPPKQPQQASPPPPEEPRLSFKEAMERYRGR